MKYQSVRDPPALQSLKVLIQHKDPNTQMVIKSYDEIKAAVAHGIKDNFFKGTLMHREPSTSSLKTIQQVQSSGTLDQDKKAALDLVTSAVGELDFKNVNAAYAAIQ